MLVPSLFPPRVRFTDEGGFLTPEALRALSAVYIRIGGSNAPNNNELAIADDDDAGLEELKAELAKALDALASQPLPQPQIVDDLRTEIAGLREQVAVLSTQIEDLKQGPML